MSSSETFQSRVLAGRYRTLRPIGAGSQGTVDLAEDLLHGGRHVAVKQLEGLLGASDPEPAAERLRWFAHPRWAEILDEGRFGEHSRFQVTRFVEGKSLDKVSLPLPEGEVWRFLEDGARVLGAIHEQGVIHYDVTPGNFLREESTAGVAFTLTDGGLASLGAVKGIARGTPRFMAPELLEGAPHDHRVDLYALGLVAFLLASGRDPVVGGGGEVLGRRRREDAPPLRSLAPAASEALEKAIALLLVKEPQARPTDADAFLAKIAALRGATPQPLGAADAASRASGGRIVGRDAEMARFREACRATISRATVLVSTVPGSDTPPPPRPDPVLLVHGPAGSGGTRLLREFLSVARSEDLAVLALSGRGGAADRRSALRRLADSIAMLGGPGESAVISPRRQSREQRPDSAPAVTAVDPRAIERFVDLCERVGQRTPFALLIEDFAELPAGTQEAIRVLSRHLLARAEHPDGRACPRVLLVVDLGSEAPDTLLIPDAAHPQQPCLALPPLAPESVKTVLAERFPGLDAPPKDLEAIRNASEGLPGILVRLLAEGLRRGDLRRDTGRWLWVTDRISTYIVERTLSPQATAAFEALSPAARAAVEALALLDQPAPAPLLEALAGAEAVRELHSSPLVAASGDARPPRYALVSRSAKDAALLRLTPDALAVRRVHLLEALAAIPIADLAPEHARLHLENDQPLQALEVLLDGVPAPHGARVRGQRPLLTALRAHPTSLDSPTKRAAAIAWMVDAPDSAALAKEVAKSFPQQLSPADLSPAADCAEHLVRVREFNVCQQLCAALSLDPDADPLPQARLLVARARCTLERSATTDVATHLTRALRLLRAVPPTARSASHQRVVATALLVASRYHHSKNRRTSAVASGSRALRHSRKSRSALVTAHAYNNLAITLESVGSIALAAWATTRALRLKRALGDIPATTGTLFNLARIRRSQGSLHEAGFLLSQSISMAQRHALHRATVLALISASDLYDLQGNPELAVDALDRVRTIALRDASPVYLNMVVSRLGELHAALGRGAAAQASLTFTTSTRIDAPARLGATEPTAFHVRLHLTGDLQGFAVHGKRAGTRPLRSLTAELPRSVHGEQVQTPSIRAQLAGILRALRAHSVSRPFALSLPEGAEWNSITGRARRVYVSLLVAALSRCTDSFAPARSLAKRLVAFATAQRWHALAVRALAVEARLAFAASDRPAAARLVSACTRAHENCDYAPLNEPAEEVRVLLRSLSLGATGGQSDDCLTQLHAAAHRMEQGPSDAGSNDRLASALRMILSFRARLQAGSNLDALLEAINEQAREITRAERSCIVIIGERGEQEVRSTTASPGHSRQVKLERVSQTVIHRAIASRTPLLLHDVFADSELLAKPSIAAMALRSVLCVPMLRGSELLGVMYADSSSGAGNFDRIDLEILGLFAEQAAAAIEAGRLVADLQRSYSELKAAQERLIRGERLRVMGEMTSGVAHEFNNLLTAILARLQLLNLGYLAPDIRNHLSLIEKAALDAAGVIRRLQSFSRDRRQQDYAVVDMAEVCADVVELLRPLWSSRRRTGRRPISVHLRAEGRLTVFGDATELREVLTNLLKNSLEALDAGGSITVSGARRDGHVHVQVADDGPGIPPELLTRVFDPFFTTKGERGTGLGLCLAQQIAERHGGEIRLESQVGSGTQAIIVLPYSERAVERKPSTTADTHSELTSVNVLVVDDDPDVRSPLCAYLEGSGHHVVGAGSGLEAIARVSEGSPDVVISDIGMPEMDGMEFCRRVRSLRPHLPVILMSGTASAIEPTLVREVGASALLAKPFTMRQVLDLLESLTDKAPQK